MLFLLLLLFLLSSSPAAVAGGPANLWLRFQDELVYEVEAATSYQGERAADQRAAADRDADGTVDPEEASFYKAQLVRAIEDPGLSGHRLDAARPARIDVSGLEVEALQGEVGRTQALRISFAATYTYDVPRAYEHAFQLVREQEGQARSLNVQAAAAPGWSFSNTSGLAATNDSQPGAGWLNGTVAGDLALELQRARSDDPPPRPSPGANGTIPDAQAATGNGQANRTGGGGEPSGPGAAPQQDRGPSTALPIAHPGPLLALLAAALVARRVNGQP